MKQFACFGPCLLWILLAVIGTDLSAQTTADSGAEMNKLIGLRNEFINRIEAMGYHPTLKPPEIAMDNPPSFGNYDDSTNTLHTSDWKTLPEQNKKSYLNDNYGNLPVPVYIWYQAMMIVDGYNEMPIATFKESITRSGNKE
jgi:hypothetical protein